MARKFERYKDKTGKLRFRLMASNGQVVATGEAYEGKASALNWIESVKKNPVGATTDDQTNLRSPPTNAAHAQETGAAMGSQTVDELRDAAGRTRGERCRCGKRAGVWNVDRQRAFGGRG